MTHTDTDLRQKLVADLTAAGHLIEPAWQTAFRSVPRDAFVTDFSVARPGSATLTPVAADDPDRLAHIYSDTTLITEFDSDGSPISSSTAPGLMALMLHALDIHDGHRVLEIGTGTGYNAALLSHRLGDQRVFSVDVDPGLVATARRRLAALGLTPVLAAGDGAAGLPDHAPFDRLITTCGLDHIPTAWLNQVRPGGMILINLGFVLARLTVHADGTADGPILPQQAGFMSRRPSPDAPAVPKQNATTITAAPTSTATLPPALDLPDGRALLSVSRPGLHRASRRDQQGRLVHLLTDTADGTQCQAAERDDGTVEVTGDQALWAEITAFLERWDYQGRPAPERHRVHVRSDGTHCLLEPS
ncbi:MULTISPECIES: methyltransferase domain-containing protein [Actinoalloteichus]|uniref:Protein-L-isoaspartate O-methyltransferase n=1 Tax=Actinoalloteichus fjordicus TaxID=1612552 RepID=A0AAC9LF28_9PSEU|nr:MULTISPECIES: methyltransferase domain-containing protein [Actinoalloteichus]APU16211.1 protein-L-isoaspartate carboxylmethyltransferase [Actinoalloteichus fjordicus]APU22272.1 protein-L-isoaspartate carboxylmethyltransferase [Actinoalloteichus sp. GBA129-24]